MNTTGLLVSSAAALIAVSNARAADAVVAEPEPAEYVKICDLYGAGYFYIPGTETCLRVGGYVRYDIAAGDAGSFDGVNHVPDQKGNGNSSAWKKNARFTLKTWTGQQTELGTLKTYTETRVSFGNSGGDYTIGGTNWQARNKGLTLNFAWIQLGGLRVGKDESAFDTFIGYAGNVINDTLIPYGGFDTNVVQYYFDAGNGLTAVASVEEGSGADTIDSYVPHLVGGLKYKGHWWAITAVGAYNSNWEEWAGKARLDVNATDRLTLFVMVGYGTDANTSTGRNFFKQWGGNVAIWGGGTYKINEKTSFNAQISCDQDKNLGVATNIAYDIVPGLKVTGELDYLNVGSKDTYNWTGATKKANVGGIVRFQRSF
ncbi:porin [Mesorhizobium qingshengii]|uniref:Porin n=1 Tax=Mesorhizobium qingshengii TaxID=1165689 RepID=A0A1G5WJA1_9HYPH|nr:porin [Mesorhizobium qingshengii]SDA58261.1 Porin subfamily protein [Mesorhizobium qingshengii]